MSAYEGMHFQILKFELSMSTVGSLEAVAAHLSVLRSLSVPVGQEVAARTAGLCDLPVCRPGSGDH